MRIPTHSLSTAIWSAAIALAAVSSLSARGAESSRDGGGIEVLSTVTPTEQQQIDQQRPVYHQPVALEGEAPATTLPLDLRRGETLVFIGNGLAERMEHHNFFETLLQQRFAERQITFRNMGFPGHTPGFRPEAGKDDPWAFPGAEAFNP